MVPFKLSSSTMHLNFGGVQIGHSRLAIVSVFVSAGGVHIDRSRLAIVFVSVYILLEGFRLVIAGELVHYVSIYILLEEVGLVRLAGVLCKFNPCFRAVQTL